MKTALTAMISHVFMESLLFCIFLIATHKKTTYNKIFYSSHVLHRLHCLQQLKEYEISSIVLYFRFLEALCAILVVKVILDFVDNYLLDLYGVEFGELAEVTSLLTEQTCGNIEYVIQ